MKFTSLLTLLLGFCVAGSSVLHAEDLYVRPNSSGARTGADWTNAWNGFSDIKWGDGAGKVGAGDTLWIAGGSYSSSLVIGASGTAASPIRIKRVRATDAAPAAAAGWNSAFDAQVNVTTGGSCIYFYNGVGSYVEIDGRVKSGIRVNYANGGSGVEIDGGVNFTDVALRYIEAAGPGPITQSSDTRGFDLTIAGVLTNLTVSHCEAHHSDTLLQVTTSRNLVIEYTDLHHAGAVNASTYHPNTIYLATVTNATIRYNTLHEIDVEGLFFGDPGNDGAQIYGNLFYQGSSAPNSGRGIEFDNTGTSKNFLIYNNTFVGLPLAGVNFENGQTHTGAVVRNNIFWNCSAAFGAAAHDYNFFSGTSNYGEAHGIANGSAPFVNASTYDYHIVGTIASNKPKDKGVNLGSPYNVDRDGVARGADGFWDIGAYEYGSGGTTPPPANTAPTIASIANQSTTAGTPVGPIAFTVGDVETAASSLVLSGSSSNTTLLPASGIAFGGSGSSRTVTLTPAAGQTGSATVTINVSDGDLSASTSFTLLVSSGTTVPPPPTGGSSDLVAAYSFNEGSGTVVADASGNGNSGQVQNATWTTSGRFGAALNFNGSSSLVYVPSSSSLSLGSAMTLQAWVYPTATLSGWRTVVQKEVDAYFLHASSNTSMRPAAGGTINGSVGFTASPAAISANGWTHLAVTYDGSTVRLYVNGVEVANQAQTGAIQTNDSALRIGGNAPYGEYFQGMIDEVRIYKRALTAAEIQSDMAAGIGSSTPPPANTAPALTAIADQTVITGSATSALAFTVSDAETAATSLTVSGSSSDTTLVPNSALVFGGSGANRTLSVTPASGRTGTATITYSVSDGSLTASRSFQLTVNPVPNTAPTISSLANVTLVTGASSGSLAFTVGDAETAAGSLSVSATSSNTTLLPAANIVLGGTGANRTVTLTSVSGQTGTATVRLTVSDGSLSASSSFTLTVTPPPNTAPTISSVADLTLVTGKPSSALAFTVGDAETAAGSLVVSASSSNSTLLPSANIVLGGSGANRTVTLTSVSGQTGTATVRLTVSDGSLSASSSFTLTVTPPPNTAPTITSVDNVVLTTGTTSAPLSFTIADAETAASELTLSVSTSNATLLPQSGLSLAGSTGNRSITVAPATGQSGSAIVTVTVSDGKLSASMQFLVTVVLDPTPSVAALSDQVTAIDVPVGPLAVTLSDNDTDVAQLTLSAASDNAALLPASAIAFGGTGADRTLTLTPAAGQTGLADVTVTVSDGTHTATRTFLVIVNAPANRGLVAAYSFNDASGTVARDSSGLGNHGELRSATWTTAGKFGGALTFNGTSANVYVKSAASLNLGNRMTLEAWVMPSASQSGWRTIVQKEVDAYFLHAGSNGALRPAAGGTFGGKMSFTAASKAIAVGAWTHLAATYDGATVRLYVNGVLAASRAQTGAIETNNNAVRIGGNVPYGEFFRGTIDEVRIYNRALAATEIQADMAAPISAQADANTWSQADIGAAGVAGSLTIDATTSSFTASGSGAGISGTADAFRYVYRSLNGDGTVEARVDALTDTGAAAQAGVMLRSSLNADAANVFVSLDPAANAAVQVRASNGAATLSAPIPMARWLRLVRVGQTIVAMTSSDGSTWSAAGVYSAPMGAQVFAGFAVTAGDNTKLASAVFAEPFIE